MKEYQSLDIDQQTQVADSIIGIYNCLSSNPIKYCKPSPSDLPIRIQVWSAAQYFVDKSLLFSKAVLFTEMADLSLSISIGAVLMASMGSLAVELS